MLLALCNHSKKLMIKKDLNFNRLFSQMRINNKEIKQLIRIVKGAQMLRLNHL